MDNCKRNLQYRAEVVFKMASDSMSVTVISKRLTILDKMLAFGKKVRYMSIFIPPANHINNLFSTLSSEQNVVQKRV